MGNDSSKLQGLVLEESVETNDFWTLSNAESPTTSNEEGRQLLSVFQGETVVSGQLWVAQGPMERAIKNLMIYRHPYILKYVTTWEQSAKKHLATERVQPLSAVLNMQSDIQICLGLRTILCSLIFLIEKALARHLNICISSIYITDTGSWRLAGFEYVWKNKDVNKTLLDLANAYRYKVAIDPEEMKQPNRDFIEQYAFATLCEELLSKGREAEIATPHVAEFREYCANHLKHKNAQMRPKLSAVLLHPYFNHEFVLIHSFLFELPLKSVQEKQDFFTGLVDRLRYFSEEVVGAQLAGDLLSRMVLLDPTAQLCVTPYVLKTRNELSSALFLPATYKRYLLPHIKRMFRLRDAQIRLILLEYFMEFVCLLPKEELEVFVLPHLLAGMHDTNDVLVAKTLRCLADLVPILGAATVLGGQRSRLFSDGRPQAAVSDAATPHWVEPRSITPVIGDVDGERDYMVSSSPLPDNIDDELSADSNGTGSGIGNGVGSSGYNIQSVMPTNLLSGQLQMPPRLSPDGGEDDKTTIMPDGLFNDPVPLAVAQQQAELSTICISHNINNPRSSADQVNDDIDEEVWSDWETDELQRLNSQLLYTTTKEELCATYSTVNNPTLMSQQSLKTSTSSSCSTVHKTINDDLNALDINVQKLSSTSNEEPVEFDFFKDMEPVIETKHSLHSLVTTLSVPLEDEVKIDARRFAPVDSESFYAIGSDIDGDGWGVDDEEVEYGSAGETKATKIVTS